jgi:hypothetical protein
MKNKSNLVCVPDPLGELADDVDIISELIKLKQPDFISLHDLHKSQSKNNKSCIVRLSVAQFRKQLQTYKND